VLVEEKGGRREGGIARNDMNAISFFAVFASAGTQFGKD
jgi:hypothetical protein